MAITTFGRILEFDEKLEDRIQYFKRLEQFFSANDNDDGNKKRVILLTVIETKAYKLLQSLLAPERIKDKSYTDLVGAMKKYHNCSPCEIVQGQIFQLVQVAGWVHFYIYVGVGTFLDIVLRDQLVCGVNDSHIQCHLLSEPVLTLEMEIKIALGMESAARNAITL